MHEPLARERRGAGNAAKAHAMGAGSFLQEIVQPLHATRASGQRECDEPSGSDEGSCGEERHRVHAQCVARGSHRWMMSTTC